MRWPRHHSRDRHDTPTCTSYTAAQGPAQAMRRACPCHTTSRHLGRLKRASYPRVAIRPPRRTRAGAEGTYTSLRSLRRATFRHSGGHIVWPGLVRHLGRAAVRLERGTPLSLSSAGRGDGRRLPRIPARVAADAHRRCGLDRSRCLGGLSEHRAVPPGRALERVDDRSPVGRSYRRERRELGAWACHRPGGVFEAGEERLLGSVARTVPRTGSVSKSQVDAGRVRMLRAWRRRRRIGIL
jgi:hypothetical protein